MILYEMLKHIKKPFIWIFLGACMLLNIIVIFSSDYYTMMSENNLAVELGTAQRGAEYADYVLKKYGAEITYSDFADTSSAEQLTRAFTSRQGNHSMYASIPQDADGSALNGLVTKISAPVVEKRIREINENKEHLWLNGGYELHNGIYSLMWLISGEAAVFALLITIRLCGFEHTERTTQTVYSTKKGHNIFVPKLFASFALSSAFLLAVLLISYLIFFAKCPCFELLGSPLIIMESPFFVIPWESFTVGEFFLLNAAFCFVTTLLNALIGFCLWGFIHNTYAASAGAVILSVGTYLLSLVIPNIPALRFFILSTPVMLIMDRAGYWFSLAHFGVPIPGFECIAAAAWAVLLALAAAFSVRKLRRMKL